MTSFQCGMNQLRQHQPDYYCFVIQTCIGNPPLFELN